MSNVTPFWTAVHALEARLPIEENAFFITSVENLGHRVTGGHVFEAGRRLTAQRIVEGSHRLATPEEIQAYHAAQRQSEEACAISEAKRKPAGAVLRIDRAELKRLGELAEPEKK
jgi:hypothetical protein